MGRGKLLSVEEKEYILQLKMKNLSHSEISKMTKRSRKCIINFLKSPLKNKKPRNDKGKFRSVSQRDMRNVTKQLKKSPAKTSYDVFESSGLKHLSKPTRCRILKTVANQVSPVKKPSLNDRQIKLRLEWARSYMKYPSNKILFSDETRASLDGPDHWQKGWVLRGEPKPVRYRRQQGGGGLMLWAGIIDDEIFGPFRVAEGVKMTSKTYTKFLEENLLPFKEKRNDGFLFMQDNAPSHSAKFTSKFLSDNDIEKMKWPPNSPDLNPIENLWGIVKSKLYKNGKKYKNKDLLWEAILSEFKKIEKKDIKKLTSSINSRIFNLILNNGKNLSKY